MAKVPKLRPSVSIDDIHTISEALNHFILTVPNAGTTAHHIKMAGAIELKRYFDSFKANATVQSKADIIAEYLAQQAILQGSPVPETTDPYALPTDPQPDTSIPQVNMDEIVTNPALTDDQKFDLLELKGKNKFSKEEQEWYITYGLNISIQRANKKAIDSSSL